LSISNLADERQIRQFDARAPVRETDSAALAASLLREKELLREMSVLSLQQDLLAQEFDHRLGNSLQMIVSLLSTLCIDIADLLLQKGAGRSVIVEGADITLPTALGIPLGFLVAEAITNSVKYATGDIIVRIQTSGPAVLLSIVDGGPGLPVDFDPMKQKGLGMKLIQSLTKQIGGTLTFGPSHGDRGTRLTVSFTA